MGVGNGLKQVAQHSHKFQQRNTVFETLHDPKPHLLTSPTKQSILQLRTRLDAYVLFVQINVAKT